MALEILQHPDIAQGRDCLLGRPGEDWVTAKAIVADYTDAVCCGQAMLRRLNLPCCSETGEFVWDDGLGYFCDHPAYLSFWTEHSWRGFLPTAAAVLHFSKDSRDYLGRWAVGQSSDYVRTSKQIVTMIQREVAMALRRNPGLLDEGEILEAVSYTHLTLPTNSRV